MQELKDDMPEMLRGDREQYYYIYLVDLLVNNDVAIKLQDAPALAAFAICLATLDECSESIANDGMMMRVQGDRHQISKINPAIAMQKSAMIELRTFFREFQMSPNSRGSLGAGGGLPNPNSGKDDGFDKL